MKRLLAAVLVAAFLCPQAAFSVTEYRSGNYANEGVSIALEDPIGSVYRDGEAVRFSIRTDSDAYVVVFNIDTEGFVHLLYPRDGKSLQRISSNRIYYLPEYEDEALVVSGKKGIEFVFAVAAPHRDDFNRDEIAFLLDDEKLPVNRRFRIDGDPLLAANRIASQLIRGISHRSGATISFTYFYLNEAVDFPRYMCEDCYETGKDPYGPNMPVYVASADFERTDRLSYPLETGFVQDYGDIAVADFGAYTGGPNTTKVYVAYYPRWDHGFYSRSWYYADPWYWGWGWGPGWSGGWYAGWGWGGGWGWGWGGCHRYYFPYYHCTPYPVQYAGRYYPTGSGYPYREFRPGGKGGTSRGGGGALHTGMTQGSDRNFRSTTRSAKPGLDTGKRTTLASTYRSGGNRYSYKDGQTVRTNSKLIRTTGLKDSGTRTYRGTKGKSVGTNGTRSRSSKQISRDQRVITRKNLGSERRRVFDRNGYKGTIDPRAIKRGGRTTSTGSRDSRSKSGTQIKSRTNSRSKSTSKRTYKPNTRRNSSKSSSGSKYRAPSSRSSSRPSGTRSKSSGGSSRSSSSRGKGRK